MTRIAKIAVFLVGVVLALLLAPYAVRLWPSALSVRLDPALAWQSVTIESYNLARPQRFTPSAGEVRISPIEHGLYRVGVQFADGQSMWGEFLHVDAGFRRRVDLFLGPSPQAGHVHLRLTASRGFLPRRLVLFDGEVRSSDASSEQPQILSVP